MKDLIARLEAATEGSRELDEDIHYVRFRRDYEEIVPTYTTSLDAAMTLVPGHLSASATRHPDGRGAAQIWRYVTEKFADAYGGADELKRRNGSFDFQNIGAATPALALCIAALKARQP